MNAPSKKAQSLLRSYAEAWERCGSDGDTASMRDSHAAGLEVHAYVAKLEAVAHVAYDHQCTSSCLTIPKMVATEGSVTYPDGWRCAILAALIEVEQA